MLRRTWSLRVALVVLASLCTGSALAVRGQPHAPRPLDGVARRKVPLTLDGAPPLSLFVNEVADFGWWEEESARPGSNPFGAKLWPAALAVAEHLASSPSACLSGLRVLEIGCGNGLCSLVAAARGASVTATDVAPAALELTRQAASAQSLAVDATAFDLGCAAALPAAELVVAADLLYDDELAGLVARRVAEAVRRGSWVLVGDENRSGRDVFLRRLRELLGRAHGEVAFEPRVVRLAALKWKEKRVGLMEFNAPEVAS